MSMTHSAVRLELISKGWFSSPGAYVIVDGQFGSTGKGLLSCVMADLAAFGPRFTHVTSNQGPNSGHTAYIPVLGGGSEKVMAQQLPIAAITLSRLLSYVDGKPSPICYLNGGAVIDPIKLGEEIAKNPNIAKDLIIHPCAAIIDPQDVEIESGGTVAKVASTGKGVGSALARKILRQSNTCRFKWPSFLNRHTQVRAIQWDWSQDVVLVEVPQGFSLGINSHQFYPYTTSRECTVMQAIADARIPHNKVRKVAACYRTYPIRVGNTDLGRSGDYYPDQTELNWKAMGLEPEMTSVTKRTRRLFTWSMDQFKESVAANQPDLIFINFLNYLDEDQRDGFVRDAVESYARVMGRRPETVLTSCGPKNGDVSVWRD